MSVFHCSCGFAINDAGEFGDHLGEVFDRGDDTGTDGREHYEIEPADGHDPARKISCACGFTARDAAEFDDHALLALLPPDSIGNDGRKHVPVDPSTPDRWYFREDPE